MEIFVEPSKAAWQQIIQRPVLDHSSLFGTVRAVLDDVKKNGDEAVKRYAAQFDKVELDQFLVTEEEINESEKGLSEELIAAIRAAYDNIRKFHEQQLHEEKRIETHSGIFCWRRSVAIEKVGLYIPGGTAPLFSTVLMLGVPAQIAGCKEVVLCSPPDQNGKLHPAILFAAKLVGITKIFKIGGIQAIAAMAYGTATVPQVYKIFGPGNQYVTAAKQLISLDGIAIDMPAGPSEVCVMADDSCNPRFVAADLLSQAEHGADSQVLLVATSKQIVDNVLKELDQQLQQLSRKELAAKALENSKAVVIADIPTAIALVNEYAPEHLIIACKDDETIADQITNAGSVFLGNYSPESVGDYASGTNHTLPTNGFAKAYSGVSVDSFVKKITYQKLNRKALHCISPVVELMAKAEGLDAHANAVRVRREGIGDRR